MADSQELRISVKVESEKSVENARLLRETFRSVTDVEYVARFEKLGRQFNLNDAQIKQLAEVMAKPRSALEGLAVGFGRAGAVMLAVEGAIKVARMVSDTFTDVANKQLEIANAARRMGNMHAAQLDENVRMMERERIERGRGIAMMETFAQKSADFQQQNSHLRREIMESIEGDFGSVVQQHFFELDRATDDVARMNLVRRFAEEINRYYVDVLHKPNQGAIERRKYLERWFGLGDIEQLTVDFVRVSKEAEETWDKNQKAAEEFWRVTTDIKDNLDKILSSVLTRAMDKLGLGWLLRATSGRLEEILQEQESLDVTTPEDRDRLRAMSPEDRTRALQEIYRRKMTPDGDAAKKQTELLTEEKKLAERLRIINEIFSAMGGGPPPAADQQSAKPEFHNAPMGGAVGESNPIAIPDHVAQPGGGAAAEARGGNPATLMSSVAAASGSATVQLGAKRVGGNIFTFDQVMSNPQVMRQLNFANPSQATSLIAGKNIHGVSSYEKDASKVYGLAYDPNYSLHAGTLAHEAGHIGRAAAIAEGRKDPNIFRRYGFGAESQKNRTQEEMGQRSLDLSVAKNLVEAGVFSPEQGANRVGETKLFMGMSAPPLSGLHKPGEYELELARHERMIDQQARRMLDRGNGGAVSGNLNVRVDAPSGVDVKATGDGMFKNGVNMDRRIQAPPRRGRVLPQPVAR